MTIQIGNTIPDKIIEIPPSKSIAQRLILAAALSDRPVTLVNTGSSHDVVSMIAIADSLGADVVQEQNKLNISPSAKKRKTHFHIGESGLACRLILPVLASLGGFHEITGEGSILRRSLEESITPLHENGIRVSHANYHLPISLNGKLNLQQKITLDGSKSSQHISGWFYAAALCNFDFELVIKDLTSKSYIDLTVDVLEKFGVKIHEKGPGTYLISGNGKLTPTASSFDTEGDYSGGANWIVAGALLKSGIKIKGLSKKTHQGDASVLELVKNVGAHVEWQNDILCVKRDKLAPFEMDCTNTPDLFPPLAALAAGIHGTSIITGTNRLINKESNRAHTLQSEFKKLGVNIDLEGNQMIIQGTGNLHSGELNSHGDHRIAMAAAIISLLTPSGLTLAGAEAVNKSYPEFWSQLGIS